MKSRFPWETHHFSMKHLLTNRKLKPLFKAPNTLKLDHTVGQREAGNRGHLGGLPAALCWAQLTQVLSYSEKGGLPGAMGGFPARRNKADSASLALAHFGRRMFGGDTNHDVGSDSDNV